MAISIIDQCGRTVTVHQSPQRIVSLVPSLTELLYDLELESRIVGITRYCVYPQRAINDKTVVGGTKKIIAKRLKDLQPDLIICNKEENTKEMVTQCEGIAPTYVSNIAVLDEVTQMIKDIGTLTTTQQNASQINADIATAFARLSEYPVSKTALYLIWKNPYMTVGNDTFIHDMVERIGVKNVAENHQRYPQITIEEIIALQPDVILFSSEPYAFNTMDVDEMKSAFIKANLPLPQCHIVDGELFSWYGSRLLKTPDYLTELRQKIDEKPIKLNRQKQ